MEIPAPKSEGNTIFDYGLDKTLNRESTNASTGVVYDYANEGINTSQILPGGSLNLKTLSVGSLVIQVAPGDNIQAAIDEVYRQGGGTVQLLAKTYYVNYGIDVKSGVSLIGAGKDVTIIDFMDTAYGISSIGTSTGIRGRFVVRNLTVQNVGVANAGFESQYADLFVIDNVKVNGSSNWGFYFEGCQQFQVLNCDAISNGIAADGFSFRSDDGRTTEFGFIMNCKAQSNGGEGFNISQNHPTATTQNMVFVNCNATSNGKDGFMFWCGVNGVSYSANIVLNNCYAYGNTDSGFYIFSDTLNSVGCITLNACTSISNTEYGFRTNGYSNATTNCFAFGNTLGDYKFDSKTENSTILGTRISSDGAEPDVDYNIVDIPVNSIGIMEGTIKSEKRVFNVINASGVTLRDGNVVVFSPTAACDRVTTTTTNGDNKVFGMVLDKGTSIAINNYGSVLTEGYTEKLWVKNGTASITIGDWLSTYSEAYYAKQAIAGDMAFAVALETPTTGTAVIKALLVTPRLI